MKRLCKQNLPQPLYPPLPTKTLTGRSILRFSTPMTTVDFMCYTSSYQIVFVANMLFVQENLAHENYVYVQIEVHMQFSSSITVLQYL